MRSGMRFLAATRVRSNNTNTTEGTTNPSGEMRMVPVDCRATIGRAIINTYNFYFFKRLFDNTFQTLPQIRFHIINRNNHTYFHNYLLQN